MSQPAGPSPGPAFISPWTFLRASVVFAVEQASNQLQGGNGVASYDGALLDGRPAVLLTYPLDIDAIALEFEFTEGHAIESHGDRWTVTCAHGGQSLIGGTQERGRWAAKLQRNWWKRWIKKPREKTVV